jgi:hypothetical protein
VAGKAAAAQTLATVGGAQSPASSHFRSRLGSKA